MTEVTPEVRSEVNASTLDLAKANPLQLAKVDLTKLDADGIKAFAEAAQARLQDATSGGLLVDKRSGLVYTNGTYIGNVSRPVKAMNVIPSAFKAKEEHIVNGNVSLPATSVNKGQEALTTSVIGAIRFLLAGQTGNGINLVGQKEKTITGAAVAMGTIKGGLA